MSNQVVLMELVDDSGYQLTMVLEGFPDDAFDKKLALTAMSPAEQVDHLCEAYRAVSAGVAGEKYEWGSYQPADPAQAGRVAALKELRAKAIEEAAAADTEEALKLLSSFVVAHDYYHVGQLASARIAAQPEWDAYSIYK